MDKYQAMKFYYGLLNLRAGLFIPNLCMALMVVAESASENEQQPATAYHELDNEPQGETKSQERVKFGSFYEDGHILHNVKINTQSDFFLDPTRGDAVKWRVKFTVAKDVRPADQFVVQLSPNLMVAPNGHPQKPIADFTDQDGIVIAMGDYRSTKHQLIYTFTNYVTEHREITGEITGELAIDPQTTPENEFGLECFISIDDYRKDFTIDVDYPDLGTDMFLGISSRMMHFDQDKHLFTDLIYVNPGQKELNHAYIVFNTSEMVEELSNAIVKPSTMRIEIYHNPYGLKLPQSYGVNLQRLREITNRFPVVKGDHLVDTPMTMSFADNKMRLNFAAENTNDSFVIKVVGQYNDELGGEVRLRARLFGVDQQNVYMSNSTAAKAIGIPMKVEGRAIPKEGYRSAESKEVQKQMSTVEQDLATDTVDELTESPEVTAMENESLDFTTVDELTASDNILEENTAEPAEQSTVAEKSAVEEEKTVEPEAIQEAVMEESLDSSAYIVSFDQSNEEPEETVEASKPEEQVEKESAVGGDEVSISFDIPAKTTATPEEDAQTTDTVVDEKKTEEVEQTTPAQMPMPSRRPPRRQDRFRSNNRAGHTMRHLRRF